MFIQGQAYSLIQNRKFQQIDVLENLNLVLSISGKKNKLRVYYLSWLKSKFLNERTAKLDEAQRNGYTSVGDLEGEIFIVTHNFKIPKNSYLSKNTSSFFVKLYLKFEKKETYLGQSLSVEEF